MQPHQAKCLLVLSEIILHTPYLFTIWTKKSGTSVVAVPLIEAFACHSLQNKQHEAHAVCKFNLAYSQMNIYIPIGHSLLHCHDREKEICEVSISRNKASTNAFLIYVIEAHLPP